MAQGGSLPAAPSRTPGLPENTTFYDFMGWNGIDTKPPRPGIEDDKSAWMDNLMPLGPHNLRALPDIGPIAYTAPTGRTIVDFDAYGLASKIVNNGPHFIIFLDDGSAIDYGIYTNATATLAPPGTFLPPPDSSIGVRQYGTNLLTIATEQSSNAFWTWDGAVLYAAGGVSPEIDILDGGRNYGSPPSVVPFGGSGGGATYTATVDGTGAVDTITTTGSGSGWSDTDPQKILLTFSGGGGPTSAYGTAVVVNGAITGITVIGGGSYTGIPSIVITDSTGSGAQALVSGMTPVDSTHSTITSISVIDCGSNYSSPTITATGTGGGLNAQATLDNGVINSFNLVQAGGPYLNAPEVFFLSATGSGAQATAILNSSGAITGLDFGKGVGNGFTGSGYSGQVIVGFNGGGVASATARLMPFGIYGHSIESYQGRIWVSAVSTGTKVFFTAPGSATNFSPGDGGGVFPATDSVLRYQWSALRQSNGFLYLVGDSSVNYVSGVTTSSAAPPITTFSNLNVDPQIGSPWTPSVEVYSRAVIIASDFGIHAIYGGAAQKISTPLDGIYDSGTIPANNPPSTAVAAIFGVHVLMVLMPIIDPFTGEARNALLMWDGKRWWTASQSLPLSRVRTMEWGSIIQAWANTNTQLFPLFQQASTLIPKTLRSKMWVRPGIHVEKKGMQLYALWQANTDTTLNFNIDNEHGQFGVTQGVFNKIAGNIGWGRSACPDNMGICIGFTMQSVAGDFQLIDTTILAQERRFRV